MSHSMDGLDSESGLGFELVAKNGNSYTRNFLLLLSTAAFVLGNLLLQTSSKLISFECLLVIFIALLSLGFVFAKLTYFSKSYFSLYILLSMVLFACFSGYSRAWLQAGNYLKHSLAADVISQDIRIPACISSLTQNQSDFARFIIEPITTTSYPSKITHVKRIRVSANIKQIGKNKSEIEFNAGDCWLWNLRLKTTRGLRNKHSFDYEKWLYLQDVGATAYLRALPEKIEYKKYPWLRFRANLAKEIKRELPSNSQFSGLILGLGLGIRDDITTEQWQVLQNTGTSHLLAISGLHIGIAAIFGFYLGKLLYLFLVKVRVLKKNTRPIPLYLALSISMLCACFYAAMAGFSVSTQRACIMLISLTICSLSARKFKASSILSIALIAVLLIDPKAILSAGTWFSFLAVAILLLLISREKMLLSFEPNFIDSQKSKFKQAAKLQFYLVFFMSVPVAFVFAKISIIAPFVNFLLIPIFTFTVVPVLLLSLMLIRIFPEIAYTLINWQHKWLGFLWEKIEKCSNFPISQIDLQMNIANAFLFFILLIPFIIPKSVLSRRYSMVLLLPFVFGFSSKNVNSNELSITVFDVGQGLSVFLQTATHHLLYDTGPSFSSGSSSAERVITPWLYAENIRNISYLVLSHSDNDHAGGFELIRENFKPQEIIAPSADSISFTKACEAGYSWIWDGVDFKFLYPYKNLQTQNTNNHSCVLRVSLHGKSILLTGDIEKEAERVLVDKNNDLQSHIVLVPHHGSGTSSTQQFVNAVSPQISVIPAGFANRWRFPKEDVLERWELMSEDVYTIADTGQLNFYINVYGEISTEAWIDTECRYWHQDCQK